MKLPLLTLSLFASLLPMTKGATDLNRVLEAIAECEGGKSNEPGGRVFCSYGVWADRAPDLAYQYSATETVAWPIFKSHLVWLSDQLIKNRITATPEHLGTAWRHGIGKAVRLRGKSPYGARIANLVSDATFKP